MSTATQVIAWLLIGVGAAYLIDAILDAILFLCTLDLRIATAYHRMRLRRALRRLGK